MSVLLVFISRLGSASRWCRAARACRVRLRADLYRATAERAYERFSKGDSFVAEGYLHEYSYERDGQATDGVEFVAKKIGHDTARTQYSVERSQCATGLDAPVRGQSRAFESPQKRPSTDAPALGR